MKTSTMRNGIKVKYVQKDSVFIVYIITIPHEDLKNAMEYLIENKINKK